MPLIEPVYPLTEGLSSKSLLKAIAGAAKNQVYPQAQVFRREGLAQEVGSAGLQRVGAVRLGVLRREDHHWRFWEARTELVQHIESIGRGQDELEQDDVGLELRHGVVRGLADLGAVHLVPLRLQLELQHADDRR